MQLYNGALRCVLGANLEQASAAYLADNKPSPQWYELHELAEQRPYFFAHQRCGALFEQLLELAEQALQGARAPYDDLLLVIASTTLDITEMEERLATTQHLAFESISPLDLLAKKLRSRFNIANAFTLNTACTSAANSLLYAAKMINAGLYKRALVLAFETPSQITLQGFAALGLVSPTGNYRPFHPERDGLILGETYSAVMLAEHAETEPFAQLLGGASACDSSNLTTTLEDGSHIATVMQQALDSAQLNAEDIGLIKLHGTATSANDSAETHGILRLFPHSTPALCLLKPYLGHTLGACGLSEILLLQQALRQGPLPAVDYAQDAILPLNQQAQRFPADTPVLCNFFGFGGNNASLIVQGMQP